MNKLTALVLIAILPLLSAGCFRQEVQIAEYHIPAMSTPTAETYLRSRVKGIRGVESITADLGSQTLTVSYKSSIVRTVNIEETIAFAGFDVNNRPANPAAKAKLEKGLL